MKLLPKRSSKLQTTRRLWHINRVLLKYGLDDIAAEVFGHARWLRRLQPWAGNSAERELARGARIRLALEELGPIFIKFGQMLSTRRDLLPLDVADELAKLQDRVPAFPGQEARAILEDTYRQPLENVFADFDETPLASASIAQVHTATLKTGESVVVKVLRPNIQDRIEQDVALLTTLAELADKYSPEARRLRPKEVVAEYEKTIFNELDLLREAANAGLMRRNWEHSKIQYIPEAHWDFCRQNVLVIERISGVPVNDAATMRAAGVDFEKLAARGVEIFFTQVFRDNFFHADMHPGNIFVDITQPDEPRYVSVDFGIVGSLTEDDQRYLAANFLAFFNRDYKRVAELHIESGWIPAHVRVDELTAAARGVLEPIFNKPLSEISFGQLLLRLFAVGRQFDMVIQPQLVLLQKTLLNIEGLGRELYPELNLWDTAKPFLENWTKERLDPRNNIDKAIEKTLTRLPQAPDLIYSLLNKADAGKLEARLSPTQLAELQHTLSQNHQATRRTIAGAALLIVAALWPGDAEFLQAAIALGGAGLLFWALRKP